MFLPIGDTPNPRGFVPWVNFLLIGLNIAVYALITLPLSSQGVDLQDPELLAYLRQVAPSLPPGADLRAVLANLSAYDLFVFAHGYKPAAPEVSDLFFSLFLHGGLLHLAGNMLFLYIFGDNVEHRMGRLGYLLTYLTTGVVATLAFAVLELDSMVPLVGASGAISGVLGIYFLLFRRNRVKVFVFLFPFLFDVLLIPARFVLGFYVLVDNLLPMLIGARSGVAYGAHLGGFLAGLGVAAVAERAGWRWPWKREARPGGPRVVRPERPEDAPRPAGLDHLRQALAAGDRGQALVAYARLTGPEVATLAADERVLLADWLQAAGHPIAAAGLLRRGLSYHEKRQDLARLYLALGLLRLRQGQPTAAYQHLLTVFDYEPTPDVSRRAREALDSIEVFGRRR